MYHQSWNRIIPRDDELGYFSDDKALERYALRIEKEFWIIPKDFLQQVCWLNDGVANEFGRIDYHEIQIVSENWSNWELLRIQPASFGKKFYHQRIKELIDICWKIERSSYGHLIEVIDSWREDGTWRAPIIVLDSSSFTDQPFHLPYQLFEWHNRLAWMHYFIQNEWSIKLADSHKIWLISKKSLR